ncbi:hypothetical protein D9619_012307 [Psilocybe cf. subviscida]|uniref:DUF4238 domain-containing protein n=1 Tax=Psilocybe cf. subviscida TaxID=2480587 RepID=A0A8H5ER38_9AGAR|nr:hypothetical protein D9619_012307 [Psilocybe cf. subviscida]
MPQAASPSTPRDQYQHYIPRFILRSFQDAQIRQRSKKQRQKDYHKARKTGVDQDVITVFDSGTQLLEQRPLAKEYGVINMYRDQRNPENVDHLEEALSKLENSAAKSIKGIHTAIEGGKGEVKMLRKELEVIRKFVYIMHYRRTSLVPSYFDENDPDNSTMRDFYKAFREQHDLKAKDDIWLWGLKYLLDTPHHKIVETGEKTRDQYGGTEAMLAMMAKRVDPGLDNFHAVDYTAMAEAFFLAIWVAPEGEEFVVGSNSFGLFEGALMGNPGLHRIFFVSPKVTLVLRAGQLSPELGLLNSEQGRRAVVSVLADIPTKRPSNHYASFVPPRRHEDAMAALEKYRRTPAAQEDVYIFYPTKLTPKQTHNVNFVLLSHLNMGGVAFSSENAMKASLKHQLKMDIGYIQESKYYLRSLLGILSDATNPESPAQVSRPALDLIIGSIANGVIELKSDYERAYRVYHAATDDVNKYCKTSAEIHAMTAHAIVRIKALLPPPPHINRHMYFPWMAKNIVKTLSKHDSDIFFAAIRPKIDSLQVGTRGTDVVSQIKYDAATIGLTHWLAENHVSALKEFVPKSLEILC